MDELKKIIERIESLEGKAQELLSKADASDSTEEVKSFQQTLNDEVLPEIAKLREQREALERDEERKAMRVQITTLEEAITELRKPLPNFGGKAPAAVTGGAEDPYVGGGFFRDIKAANKGRQDAFDRLATATGAEGKAMTEGTPPAGPHTYGGYLVTPQIERAIVEGRENDNVLRALFSKLNVTTNEVQFDSISLGTTAGWVAELAEKPELLNMALASVSAGVFTAAGLATVSNQLLADSNPAVDGLLVRDLRKRLIAVEEAAFMDGTGTNQPLGLLRTPGIQTQDAGAAGDPAADGGLLDAILSAIAKVQTEHGEPTAIVMHPRTWTAIIKARDAQGLFWLGGGRPDEGPTTTKALFGVRVVTSNRMPTNAGTGTDESRIIVGDFSEGLILDRQGITVDESPHVYFTSNQTVFRAEMRVGFTAARQPKAFCVVGGAGLAGR